MSTDLMPADGQIWNFDQQIASDPVDGRMVVAQVLEELERQGWSEDESFGVHLALEEALVNAIKHGNQGDTSKRVDVACRISCERAVIKISDEGDGFDPDAVPDPTEEANLEMPSGRGLMLMRCYMTSVAFNAEGNQVTMEKIRGQDEFEDDEDDEEDD